MVLDYLIPSAYAADAAHAGPAASGFSSIIMMLVLFGLFYLLLIRPQSKRARQHRELVSSLSVGDEVLTSGGVAGKITRVDDQFIIISVAKDVELTVQRPAISTTLPKGTLNI